MVRRLARAIRVAAVVVATASTVAAQSGTFRAASTYALPGGSGDATSILEIADVGSQAGPLDGIPDVVVAAQSQQVGVLFGRADGRLAVGPNTGIQRIPSALALGNFNGDASPDFVVTDTGSKLVCFRGFSDGPPFEMQGEVVDVGSNPVAIASYDFDEDGGTDIAVLNEGNQTNGEVRILLSDGDCTFSAPEFPAESVVPTGSGSSALVVVDLNGDGAADIAVTNATGNDVSILRGSNEGDFTEVQRIDVVDPSLPPVPDGEDRVVEPIGIGAADFDEDGVLDLAVVNRNTDQVVLLLGNGDATFAAARYFPSGSAGSSPTDISVGDANNDGHADVVVANNRSSDASILLGDGTGDFDLPRVFMADQEPLAVGLTQLNGDGHSDIIVTSRGNQGPTAAVLLGLEGGAVASIENVPADPSPVDVAVGDFDNDGLPDLAMAHGNGTILIARAEATGGFAPMTGGEVLVGGSVSSIVARDIDGDSVVDLVAAKDEDGEIALLRGQVGGGFTAPAVTAVGNGVSAIVAGDWNEDGFTDVAATRQLGDDPGRVELLFGGQAGLTSPQSILVGLTPVAIAEGDFNADSHRDLLIANNVSGFASVLLGDGDGAFTAADAVSVGGSPRSLAVGDFDRDGCDDFVVGLSMNGVVVPFFGNCSAGFERGPLALSGAASPAGIVARDFSGDLRPDVGIADEVDNMVLLYTKLSGNRFFTNLPNDDYIVSRRPIRMVAGDFNGDGRYDAVALNSFVAGSASVMTNVTGGLLLRGDANGDGSIAAADMVGVLREVADGDGTRPEDAADAFPGGVVADANGDAVIDRLDARAVVARIFPRI